ncbi:hypothetical protein CR513_20549, partial [Mucuna pruriens]
MAYTNAVIVSALPSLRSITYAQHVAPNPTQHVAPRPCFDVSVLTRSNFPPGFVFGTASSAYQVNNALLITVR